MIDAWRRGWNFRLKVRSLGLRVDRTDWMRLDAIRFRRPDSREILWRTAYDSPHYALLTYQKEWHVCRTDYWRWQVSLRGVDHPRPDSWIHAMAARLQQLHRSIRRENYRLECVADRIAVTPDRCVWDGGHRLACLAADRWVLVPVVWVGRCS